MPDTSVASIPDVFLRPAPPRRFLEGVSTKEKLIAGLLALGTVGAGTYGGYRLYQSRQPPSPEGEPEAKTAAVRDALTRYGVLGCGAVPS